MAKLRGLGKGLQSLIPAKNKKTTIAATPKDDTFYVETSKIHPNKNQPRRDFDQDSLAELAASIKQYGVLQPLLVAKNTNETNRGIEINYEIIAGERRWRAAQLAGARMVPVVVKDNFNEDKVKLEVALVENVQRKDLNPLEEAEAYALLAANFDMTQKAIATRVGKSREVVANAMRILDLPAAMKEAVRAGKLSRTQARTLLSFKDGQQQNQAFKAILAGEASVRRVEEVARERKAGNTKTPTSHRKHFDELQSNLTDNIGSAVLIKSTSKGGKIEIRFASLEELNKISKAILG